VTVTGRRSSALVWAAAGALALAAAACSPAPEPLFRATCTPGAGMDRVTCTIRNDGKQASRACFRARAQPEAGEPLIARRVCTKVLEPGQSIDAAVQFELGRHLSTALVTTQCMKDGRFACKLDVVETSYEMTRDIPRER